MPPESSALRVIDANLNRVGEGLRILEDLVRFILNDVDLTRELKTMRHQILESSPAFNQQLLQSRDSVGDIGVNLEAVAKRDLPIMAVANSRRVQESLRSIEELAKLPGVGIDSGKFKEARFKLYTIERELVSRLTRQDKTGRLTGLYVVIDTDSLDGRDPVEVAGQAVNGGARTIQLRDKHTSKKDLLLIAGQIKNICAEHDVLFIMNDYLDIALAADADGLHIGQDDLPAAIARHLLPIDKVLGASAATVDEAAAAQKDGADYIGVGSIYPTTSKEAVKVVGLKTLGEIRKAVTLPIVAIGGITLENAAEVMSAGADAVAVISAVLKAPAPEAAARQIVSRIESGR